MAGGGGGEGEVGRRGGMLIAWLYLLNCLLVVLIAALIDAEMKKIVATGESGKRGEREAEGWRMKDYHGEHMEMAPL